MQDHSRRFWGIVEGEVTGQEFLRPRVFMEGVEKTVTVGPHMFDQADDSFPEIRVLKSILKNGGIIQQTEDPELIREARELMEQASAIQNLRDDLQQQGRFNEKMTAAEREALFRYNAVNNRLAGNDQEREGYAIGTIAHTLMEGETGILLWGSNHEMLDELPTDIEVELLDPRLTEINRELRESFDHEWGESERAAMLSGKEAKK